jgi:hypothetical protein
MRSKYVAAVVIPFLLGLLAFALGNRVMAAPTLSQNGWSVVDQTATDSYQVPGSKVKLRVRKGDASVVLLDVASWFDRNIEDIDVGADDWGWAARKIEGSTTYSNHASGTAVDLNATRHPQGVATTKNLSAVQIDAVHARLRDRYKGAVRWGGDYRTRPDAMHFELNKDAAAVKAVAAAIQAGAAPAAPPAPRPVPTTTPPPPPPAPPAPVPVPVPAPVPVPVPPTVAPVPTPAPTTAVVHVGGGEEEGHEEMGPVEPQAPVASPAPEPPEVPGAPPMAVKVKPAFTG